MAFSSNYRGPDNTRSTFYKLLLLTGIFITALIQVLAQSDNLPAPAFAELKAKADNYYENKSYALALKIYEDISALPLSPEQQRWITYRRADSQWRAQEATRSPDDTILQEARITLEDLLHDIEGELPRPQLWAEGQESLGDSWWMSINQRNWNQAWHHYEKGFDFWAGSSDLQVARHRYLNLAWKITQSPDTQLKNYTYGYSGNYLPVPILENLISLSIEPGDKAQAHYLMAMTLRSRGGQNHQLARIGEEFTAALELGKKTDWYDDALFNFAQWAGQSGHNGYDDNGNLFSEPDFEKALMLYRRLLTEYKKGETRYYDSATSAINEITTPKVNLSVPHVFTPGAEVFFNLNWRQTDTVEITIYPVKLARDVDFSNTRYEPWQWLQTINTDGKKTFKKMSQSKVPKRPYYPMSDSIRLEGEIPPGAYLIEARGGEQTARDIILVNDSALVLKTTNRRAVGFFCNAVTGKPIPEGKLVVWEYRRDGDKSIWNRVSRPLDGQGLANIKFKKASQNRSYFASAIYDEQQAFAISSYNYNTARSDMEWRIYAYTDRPAYRPEETVYWKAIARQYDDESYFIPSEESITYHIDDPRGSTVQEGRVTVNAFGAFWDDLTLTPDMTLGVYNITFQRDSDKMWLGSAALFRLEEYKLPEFKVSITLGDTEVTSPGAYQMGDTVIGTVQADYYFGGPVPNADVELIIYRRPFFHGWKPAREFSWYYDNSPAMRWRYYGGPGEVVKRETLQTDTRGVASFSIDTPQYSDQDHEYTIEARITDASRRGIVKTRSVKVTRQSYFVYLEPEHRLYQPNDQVKIFIHAFDANSRPVRAEGRLRLTRDRWKEIWIDDHGREISGEKLSDIKARPSFFHTFTTAPQDYRLKSQGYETEEIEITRLMTNNDGEAVYTFEVPQSGYYRVAWVSRDKSGQPIKSDTALWAAKNRDTELGYHPGGVSIIVDKETFKVGNKAPVMLTVPANDRYLLFSVGAEDILSAQVVHVEGTAKLLTIQIDKKHSPNSFLEALMVSDFQIFQNRTEIVTPPYDNFLKVEVTPDAEGYQPGEKGLYSIVVTDNDGKPVSAEVSLGLIDEAVYYIQPEMALDIRQFFFGQKRVNAIRNASTFEQKSYFRFKPQPSDLNGYRVGLRQMAPRESFEAGGLTAKSDIGTGSATRDQLGRVLEEDAVVMSEGYIHAGEEPVVVVRSDFRSTAFWQPAIITDKEGKAKVEVSFPDSLTTWKAKARAVSQKNHFGSGENDRQTRLPLIARLQAPRFFLTGDTLFVSGIFNNNTSRPMRIHPKLEATGIEIEGYLDENGGLVKGTPGPIETLAESEVCIDWQVRVTTPGETHLILTGKSSEYADAMTKQFPVYEHGIEKFMGKSGKTHADHLEIPLDIPAQRKKESTALSVQVTPSMAVTLLDALPYLIDYPYGCTEQTMSRFLPAIIVAKTLNEQGIDSEAIAGKIFGGIERKSIAATHPRGSGHLEELDTIVRQGLRRLYDLQHTSGGWGWWEEGDDDHFMSAYVTWGLTLAHRAGVEMDTSVLQRAQDFLEKELVEEEFSYDLQSWMLHALAARYDTGEENKLSRFEAKAFLNLMKNRDQLNAYSRALLALSAKSFGFEEDARLLVKNLQNGVKIDERPDQSILINNEDNHNTEIMGTAHWGEDGIYWRWSQGGVEATAFALMAILNIDPDNKLVEPVTNWLVKNRRGSQWSNTRDTAIVILALNEYLKVTGELDTVLEYELLVNGQPVAEVSVDLSNVLEVPSSIKVDRNLIKDGRNIIEIHRKSGEGPIYFAVNAEYFSLEDPITAEGNEIFVERQFYRIKNVPTLLKGFNEEKALLVDGEFLASGDRFEVVLTIDGKNNYEYLIFEDLKAAGFESVQLRSGGMIQVRELKAAAAKRDAESIEQGITPVEEKDRYTERSQPVYQELRDRKIASFINRLPEGYWEIRYRLRAEVPGEFHALPILAHAMYVPEIRANGTEIRLSIKDRK